MASSALPSVTVRYIFVVLLTLIYRDAPANTSIVEPVPFTCHVVNATFVDCRYRGFHKVPSRIPASVETLLLSHNTINKITNESFHGLVNLVTLDLNHNSISKLKADFFKDQSRLRNLILHHNQIGKLPSDTFQYTPNLEVLDLSYMNNGFLKLPGAALRGLSRLRKLNFKSNRLSSADFGTQLNLTLLESLNIGKNRITALHQGDFEALGTTKLQTIDLSENMKIVEVDTNAFAPLASIGELDCSQGIAPEGVHNLSNALESVSVGTLYLQKIGIKYLKADDFRGLHNSSLQKLDLSFNNLTYLNSSFIALSNLTSLILHKNEISDISPNAFAGLDVIAILDLSNNSFVNIANGTFKSLSTAPLHTLYLNGNKLLHVDKQGSFLGLPKLRYLKISKNKICQRFTGEEFIGLDSLEVLDLGINANVSFGPNAFRAVPTLQTLYLNLINLKNITVQPSPFDSLHALKVLDLSNNNMAAVDVKIFSNLVQLKTLYLQHNNLYNMWNETAHVHFLESLINLKYLDLCFNGFQNIPNKTLATLRRLETLHLCHNKISHLEGVVFEGLKIHTLNLQYNNINLVNRTVLAPILGSLQTLEISNNPFSCSCELQWFRNWIDVTNVIIPDLSKCKCASPPPMTGKPLLKFHPETLNCDHRLPLYVWIVIGVGSGSIVLVSVVLVKFRWHLQYIYYLINAKRRGYKRLPGDDNGFKYDAFISFSNADRVWVEQQLLPHLESADEPEFKLCFHERDFIPGRMILDSIVEAVDASRYTLCILTTKYLESHWCKRERQFAMANIINRDVLILIVIEDIPEEKLTRYEKLHRIMKKRTYLKWPHTDGIQREVFWQKLKKLLRDPRMRVNNNTDV